MPENNGASAEDIRPHANPPNIFGLLNLEFFNQFGLPEDIRPIRGYVICGRTTTNRVYILLSADRCAFGRPVICFCCDYHQPAFWIVPRLIQIPPTITQHLSKHKWCMWGLVGASRLLKIIIRNSKLFSMCCLDSNLVFAGTSSGILSLHFAISHRWVFILYISH